MSCKGFHNPRFHILSHDNPKFKFFVLGFYPIDQHKVVCKSDSEFYLIFKPCLTDSESEKYGMCEPTYLWNAYSSLRDRIASI